MTVEINQNPSCIIENSVILDSTALFLNSPQLRHLKNVFQSCLVHMDFSIYDV